MPQPRPDWPHDPMPDPRKPTPVPPPPTPPLSREERREASWEKRQRGNRLEQMSDRFKNLLGNLDSRQTPMPEGGAPAAPWLCWWWTCPKFSGGRHGKWDTA
jgi:hypothetical protein